MTTTYFSRARHSAYLHGYSDGEVDSLNSHPRYGDMATDDPDYVDGYDDGYEGKPRAMLSTQTSA